MSAVMWQIQMIAVLADQFVDPTQLIPENDQIALVNALLGIKQLIFW